jgi:hypothetical protein
MDIFFKWAPIGMTVIQLLFLPFVIIVLKDQVEKILVSSSVLDSRVAAAIARHNSDIYSHPALADLKQLEDNIGELTTEVRDLGLKIERLTPRRRGDAPMLRE